MRGLSPLYSVVYLESVIRSDTSTMSREQAERIKNFVYKRLSIDPLGYGKPSRYSFSGHRRLCVDENTRVIYRIDQNEGRVLVVAIREMRPIVGKRMAA